jgi:hypothetical protein
MIRSEITYRPNPTYREGQNDRPRMFASIELNRLGADERVSALPIYFRHLKKPIGPVRQVYSASIAGLTIEKGNLNSLEKTMDLYLGALIHFGRLPEYLFCLNDRAWPIYRLSDQLVTRYPGRPVLEADNIGELRVALADYFKMNGFIRFRKELSILHLTSHDLQLYPPVCVFRAPGMVDVPVFPVQNGRGMTLVAPVNTHTITVTLGSGTSLLKLHEQISTFLISKGRINRPVELTIRKLSEPTWDKVKGELTVNGSGLRYHDFVQGRLLKQEVPVYANGKALVAARTNHLGRTALYVAQDIWDLQQGLGQELHARGKLSSPDYVTIGRVSPG